MDDFKNLLKRDLLLWIAVGFASSGFGLLQFANGTMKMEQVGVGILLEMLSVATFFFRAYLKKEHYLNGEDNTSEE